MTLLLKTHLPSRSRLAGSLVVVQRRTCRLGGLDRAVLPCTMQWRYALHRCHRRARWSA